MHQAVRMQVQGKLLGRDGVQRHEAWIRSRRDDLGERAPNTRRRPTAHRRASHEFSFRPGTMPLSLAVAQMCEPIELTATGNVYAKQQDANLNLQVWSDAQLNPHGTCTPAGSSGASRATVAAAALLVLAWAN